MRNTARAIALSVTILLSSVILVVATIITAAVALAATALIVPGTGTHNVNSAPGYKENARDYYMTTTPCVGNGCTLIGVDYPATFFPIVFLDGWCEVGRCQTWNTSVGEGVANVNAAFINQLVNNPGEEIVIFGYSQGARVVSIEKENLAGLDQATKDKLSIVVIGNISRPNGGLWSRLNFLPTIPIIDVSFGNPTPTDTGIKTTDIAFEYDGVSDFPLYFGNPLAVLNAIAGFQYVHGTYLEPNFNSQYMGLPGDYTPEELADQMNPALHPENFRYFGDTTYITIPTKTLPIVRPFLDLASATGTTPLVKPIVDLISPTLRVLIDLGYDRSINPGMPMQAQLFPLFINPITLTADLVNAAIQGVENALGSVSTTPVIPFAPPPAPAPLTTVSPLSLASLDANDPPATTMSQSGGPQEPQSSGKVASLTVAPQPAESQTTTTGTGSTPSRLSQPGQPTVSISVQSGSTVSGSASSPAPTTTGSTGSPSPSGGTETPAGTTTEGAGTTGDEGTTAGDGPSTGGSTSTGDGSTAAAA